MLLCCFSFFLHVVGVVRQQRIVLYLNFKPLTFKNITRSQTITAYSTPLSCLSIDLASCTPYAHSIPTTIPIYVPFTAPLFHFHIMCLSLYLHYHVWLVILRSLSIEFLAFGFLSFSIQPTASISLGNLWYFNTNTL